MNRALANPAPSVDGGIPLLFHIERLRAAATEERCYPNSRDPSNTIIEPTAGGLKL